jgi:CxxC motif-containing protein (DUF1111 family)
MTKGTRPSASIVNLLCLSFGLTAFAATPQNNSASPTTDGKQLAIRHQLTRHTKPPAPNSIRGQLGDPLQGLTAAQLAAFTDGKDDFETAETVEGGLGPIFNRDSCVACHSGPATGGSSVVNVTRFGLLTNGHFDGLESLGGSLLQDHAITPLAMEVIPMTANVVAERNSTPLFGLGLIEAIPESAIIANSKKRTADGVQGRVSMVTDVVSGKTKVGRFGWKAQQASILGFSADAYLNEMGITNRFFPTENAPNGDQAILAETDKVADPEDQFDPISGKSDVDKVADFMTLLAPPNNGPLRPTAAAGKLVFDNLGCASCHTPVMMTDNRSSIAALRNREVKLFSDLLLHDMGTLGDGIAQGAASPTEMRTAPLWGLRFSAPYLHNGKAATIEDAIKAHDGEGNVSRDRFNRLKKDQKAQLIDFLNSI